MIHNLASSFTKETKEKENFSVKILLVDDKQENLFSLEELLSDDEYNPEFIKCTSGNQALSVALKEDLALILLDVQMPGMDGYEVARFLKENKKTRSIPIIFVTALDHEINYILEGYKKGAVDYLFKPLNPSITRAKVKAFILSYLQQKELEQKNQMLHNLIMLINNSIDLMCILDADTLEVMNINPSLTKTFDLDYEKVLNHPVSDLPFEKGAFEILKHTYKNIVVFENATISKNEKRWFSWSFVRSDNKWFGNGKEITRNKIFEKKLESTNEELEKKVLERTADLQNINDRLKKEIDRREVAEGELKRNNERLAKANEELDSFVYTASHDLKAPIANIELLLSILKKKTIDKVSEEDKKLFDMIDLSMVKFNNVLKDLSTIVSFEKELEEDYHNVDILSVFQDVKSDITQLIDRASAQIIPSFTVNQVFYTRKNIRSIMYNLLSNAIKYRSPERTPVVEIKTYIENEFVVLSVRDNGLGLSPTQKERMFGMFRRFHTHVEGSGIGLFLLKKILDNSGGKIEIESEEGVGTEFKVFIKS